MTPDEARTLRPAERVIYYEGDIEYPGFIEFVNHESFNIGWDDNIGWSKVLFTDVRFLRLLSRDANALYEEEQ